MVCVQISFICIMNGQGDGYFTGTLMNNEMLGPVLRYGKKRTPFESKQDNKIKQNL